MSSEDTTGDTTGDATGDTTPGVSPPPGVSLDLLDDENVLRTIAVTLMQIKDYLAVLTVGGGERAADKLEEVHGTGKVMMPPPVLLDSTIEVGINSVDPQP